MSKSTGNFLTLRQSVERFSADGKSSFSCPVHSFRTANDVIGHFDQCASVQAVMLSYTVPVIRLKHLLYFALYVDLYRRFILSQLSCLSSSVGRASA